LDQCHDTKIDHHSPVSFDPTLEHTIAIEVPWLQSRIENNHSVRLVLKESRDCHVIHTAFVLHLPDSSTACEQVVVAYSHPELWGFMIHFDLRIFLKWVGEKPPTRLVWLLEPSLLFQEVRLKG